MGTRLTTRPICVLADRPIGRDGGGVREQQVLRHGGGFGPVAPARCVPAFDVTLIDDHPRLVDRRPQRHAIAQRAVHQLGILGEPIGGLRIGPAAAILQRLRQVPMVERHHRLDAMFQQRVDQPAVEVEPGLIRFGRFPRGSTRDHEVLKR